MAKKKDYFIRCNQTGVIYDTIRDAANDLNVNKNIVCMHLAGTRNHAGGYTFSKVKSKDFVGPLEPICARLTGGAPGRKVRCNETGETFPSMLAADKAIGAHAGNVNRHMLYPDLYRKVKGFTFSFVK